MVIILNYLQEPIKIMHQPGIHRACTIVQIFLVICLVISTMKSRGAHIISALSTFLSGSACLFSTLAMVAASPSSVLC
jgi:hypothetical protein